MNWFALSQRNEGRRTRTLQMIESMKESETDRTVGRWIDSKLVWNINGKDVTDADLRAWCHHHMEYPKGIIGACVLQMHVDAYAKAHP